MKRSSSTNDSILVGTKRAASKDPDTATKAPAKKRVKKDAEEEKKGSEVTVSSVVSRSASGTTGASVAKPGMNAAIAE